MRVSFRTRLAVAMGAVILLLSAAMYFYLPRKLEDEAIALISHKAETLAQLTAFTIHPAVYFQDRAALEEALSGTRQDQDVAYVIVTDPTGKTLASFHPERREARDLYHVTAPIRDGDRELARLHIGMSLTRLRREISEMRVAIGVGSVLFLAMGLLAVMLISNVLTRLRELSKRLLIVQEEERIRIAREVHDELGQALTALKIDLQRTDAASARKIDDVIDLVRRIAGDLRPAILDDLGITAAFEQQLRRLRESTGIETALIAPAEPELDMLTSVTLYRIVQEALANVVRHANASAVEISLAARAEWVELAIRDNGRGMKREKLTDPKSLGLLGIRERAELLGGHVAIDSRPGEGTVLTVTLPRAKDHQKLANPLHR